MEGVTLATALEREHREIDGGIEAYTAGLAEGKNDTAPLLRAMDGLRRHIYLEEEFLFPPLRAGGLMVQLFVMVREHGDLWKTMEALDASLAADEASDALLELCATLLAQLDKHNTKEEPIIYPQADAVLSEEASAQLKAFLDSGRMPEGWVCQKAR
ncbi:hemerythrin domain-containing protein [Parafrigoribacterium mesophilum]|uniref:hemerythrin domain-containing protein n=1 Tax=Parafrigoribacterium mesophilum TaxID=433646 RepID=UPI0031FD8171